LPQPGPRPSLRALLLAVLCHLGLTLALAGSAWAQAGAAGKIVHLKGLVETFSAQEAAWKKPAPGQFLAPGDAVRTGADGWAAILLADESLLQINRQSHLVLKQVPATAGWHQKTPVLPAGLSQKRSVYRVESGEIWLRNKNAAAAIEIQTPTVSAGVRGTELDLSVAPDLSVTLTVLEGRVGAWNERESLELARGEQLVARPGQPLVKRLLVSPEDAVQWTIPIPPLLDYRDLPLLTKDLDALARERQSLEAALQARPRDEARLIKLGQVERDLGRPGRAAELFEAALQLRPGQARALTGLGWTWLDRRRPEEALKAFEAAQPPEPMTWLGRSAAQALLGLPGEAARAVSEGLKFYPGSPLLRLQEAFLLLSGGRIKEAQEVLGRLTADRPEQGLAWGLLALSRLALNHKAEALKAAQEAVRTAPGSPTPWLIKAYAHQAAFDLEAALEATGKALALAPDNVPALVNLGKLRFGMDYLDRAWAAVERAVGLAPGDAEARNVLGFLLLARGRADEATAAFNRAAELDPGLGEPHLGLALAHMRRGNEGSALEELSTAVLLEPRRALFLSYWGKMLYQIRRLDRAMDVLEMARRLDPNDPTPELYQAIILRDKNRPGEAIQAVNRAIALNDNRAVYRSRFLLDKDLAVKNVALSILYDQLGLQAWAFNKATASVKSDYMNSSGHLFLAGTLLGLEGRGRAGAGEQLLARILEPANVNSANQFNEYTCFFEKPSFNGLLSGQAGSHDLTSTQLIGWGAVPAANLFLAADYMESHTDGWRDTNYQTSRQAAAMLKWDASLKQGLMLAGSHSFLDQGDSLYPRYEYDSPVKPDDFNDIRQEYVELGYRYHFSPDADLIFYASSTDSGGRNSSHDLLGPYGQGSSAVYYDYYGDTTYGQAYNMVQGQFHWRLNRHQLILGSIHYWGRKDVSDDWAIYPSPGRGGGRQPILTGRDEHAVSQSFHTYYVQDIWRLSPSLTAEAGLYFDVMDAGNAFAGTEWSLCELNPRLGFIWTPTERDTFRLAGFRYLMPYWTSRIDPMDVAGVTIFFNYTEASLIQEADLVWEREWSSGFFAANPFYSEREYNYEVSGDAGGLRRTDRGRLHGLRLSLNQLLGHGLGLAAGYSYLDLEDEQLPEADRREHRAGLALTFVHPSGFSAQAVEIVRHLLPKSEERENETIWLTDLKFGYELPGKWGTIGLQVYNLFDQHFNWITDQFVFQGRAPERQIILSLSLNF